MAARRLRRPAEGVDGAGRRSIGSSADRARGAGAACRRATWQIRTPTGNACARRATELQALIEAVVVPETWFFRDREAFAALARLAHEEWLPTHPDGVLRLLSLPCSTGEEPYSMAMALLDAGVPADRFRIDAVDISARALAQARRAVYGKNSFRGQELAFRDRHFEATAHGLSSERRRSAGRCAFSRATCSPPISCRARRSTTSIFCRNVLIYFDRATQDRAHRRAEAAADADGRAVRRARPRPACCSSHDFVSANDAAGVRVSQERAAPAAQPKRGRAPPVDAAPRRRRGAGAAAPVRRCAARRSAGRRRTRRSPTAEPSARPRRSHAARRPGPLRRSGHLLRGASAPAWPVGDGVSSAGPGARRHRQSAGGRRPTTARRSISIPITTRR